MHRGLSAPISRPFGPGGTQDDLFLNFRNIACRLTQISCISIPVPSLQRGARAIVTDAGRDAMDVAASGTTRDGRAGFP